MSALTDKTVLFIDGGLFLPLAFRLAREAHRLLYYCPGERPFPILADAIIGDGFEEIERVRDVFKAARDSNLAVVPDVGHSDLETELETSGLPVWGSRRGDRLELDRHFLKGWQRKKGLEVPEYFAVTGLAQLWSLLQLEDNWDSYIKVSRFRGDTETYHFINPEVSRPWFQQMGAKWGPLCDRVSFIVEKSIEAVTEIGFDGYCIDGRFPKVAVQGVEGKDKVYLGAVTDYADLPEELTAINEKLAEELEAQHYRNFFSTEVRVTKEGQAFLTDPTCRHASPAGEGLHELIENLGDIIVAGAQGEMVQPEYGAKFAVQAMIDHPGDPMAWRTLEVPKSVRRWVKLFFCCQVGETIGLPPLPWNHDTIGSVVGLGDTIEEAMDDLNEHAEELKGQDLEIKTAALADVLRDIREAEKAGMEFTSQPVPPPSAAIEND